MQVIWEYHVSRPKFVYMLGRGDISGGMDGILYYLVKDYREDGGLCSLLLPVY